MFSQLDAITRQDYFGDASCNGCGKCEDCASRCDGCNKLLHVDYYNFINDHTSIDFCIKCFKKFANLFDHVNYDYSAAKLHYNCIICFNKLAQGVKLKLKRSNQTIDICKTCHDIELSRLKNLFDYITINTVFCDRASPVAMDISSVNRIVPKKLESEITPERVEMWVEIVLDSIVEMPSPSTFGSVKNWVIFTDMYEIPYTNSASALIVECGGNHRVASVLSDDHARVTINIIFDNLDEYFSAFKTWEKERAKYTEEYLEEMLQEFLKIETRYDNNDGYLAILCTEFSGYIRLKKLLDV
jgi:hypothetical protein